MSDGECRRAWSFFLSLFAGDREEAGLDYLKTGGPLPEGKRPTESPLGGIMEAFLKNDVNRHLI